MCPLLYLLFKSIHIDRRCVFLVDGNKFVMRADDWSIVNASARGRDSVRISSQTTYDEAVFVLDLAHMPAGCATWPAFWTKSQTGPWPVGGEVDIIEGTRISVPSLAFRTTYAALVPPHEYRCQLKRAEPSQFAHCPRVHDSPCWSWPATDRVGLQFRQCARPEPSFFFLFLFFRDQKKRSCRTSVSDNCDASVDNNSGCAVLFDGGSYGASFNLNGGGYYAISRSRDNGIQIWFWQRNNPSVPPEIAHGQGESLSPNPTWGEPAADFPLDPNDCNYDQHFNAHMIIFDLTFCVGVLYWFCTFFLTATEVLPSPQGDWASSDWATSSCSSQGTCENCEYPAAPTP
jgi:hypothetical protein